MTQYNRHKKSVEVFHDIISSPASHLIIHYSCESFVDKEDGRTPRITTIAVRYFESSQTKTFSIHEVAEQKNVAIDEIEENYDSLEFEMLSQYFEFVQKHERYKWIHWNMRDSNYGFYAIENRYKVLGGQPIVIPDDKKIDLARNLVNCFGRGYIENPRMEKLVDKNHLTKLGFLTGKEEAEAFENKQYIRLRNSTLRKVDLFYSIVVSAAEGKLQTNAKWKEIYGVSIQGIYEALKERWWFNIIIFIIGLLIGSFFSAYI
jgi:hypothetical protein